MSDAPKLIQAKKCHMDTNIIEKNDNIFLGISVYAQQIVSLIGCIVVVILLLYINLVLKKKKPCKVKQS